MCSRVKWYRGRRSDDFVVVIGDNGGGGSSSAAAAAAVDGAPNARGRSQLCHERPEAWDNQGRLGRTPASPPVPFGQWHWQWHDGWPLRGRMVLVAGWRAYYMYELVPLPCGRTTVGRPVHQPWYAVGAGA